MDLNCSSQEELYDKMDDKFEHGRVTNLLHADVKHWANNCYLTQETLDLLIKEGFTSLALIRLLKPSNVAWLIKEMPMAQQLALPNAIDHLVMEGNKGKNNEQEFGSYSIINNMPSHVLNKPYQKLDQHLSDMNANAKLLPSEPPTGQTAPPETDLSNQESLLLKPCNQMYQVSADRTLRSRSLEIEEDQLLSINVNKSTCVELPQCGVCGAESTGFHYGAVTCDPCKSFFRRCLLMKIPYICLDDGPCDMSKKSRKKCGHCRWKKCLALGMSKNASKLGRYSLEKINMNIREMRKRKRHGSLGSIEYLADTTVVTYPSVLPRPGVCTQSVKTEQRRLEIIQHITKVHLRFTPYSYYELEKKPFQIPMDFMDETGASLTPECDGQKDVLCKLQPYMESCARHCTSFAKSLPGFTDLPLQDQISLVKSSHFKSWLIFVHKAVNRKHKLLNLSKQMTWDSNEMTVIHSADFVYKVFSLADRLQKLELTTEEICTLAGLSIMSLSCCNLQKPDVIEKHQQTLLDCYCLLIKANHQNHGSLLATSGIILSELTALGVTSRLECKALWDWDAMTLLVQQVLEQTPSESQTFKTIMVQP